MDEENRRLMKTSQRAPSSPPKTPSPEDNAEIEISAILTKLAIHYWRPDFTPAQMRHLMADYLEDLGGYSPAEISAACLQYRRDASPECRFYPRTAQLLALLKPEPEHHCRLPTFRAPPALEAPQKTKSVGDVLREAGHIGAAEHWDERLS